MTSAFPSGSNHAADRAEAPVRILLVEDNIGDARLICEMLRAGRLMNADVTHADGLHAAIEYLSERSADVILLDLSLPESSGLESLRQTKPLAGRTPILVLTGLNDDNLALQALQSGAHDYIRKGETEGVSLVRAIRYAIERRRLAELEVERRDLKESLRAMDRVLAVVGHELRTPLAALRAMAELMLTGECSPEQISGFVHSMQNETLWMAETISNILEMARLNSGCVNWQWDTVHLHDVCREASGVVEPLVDSRRVKLSFEVAPHDLAMKGDASAVRRLLINLIANAARHTEEGFIRIHARKCVDRLGSWIELVVTDTGTGMTNATMEKLGQAFALCSGPIDTDHSRSVGLGLSICCSIVAVHRGNISVRSAPDRGSRFLVRLRADLSGPESEAIPPSVVTREAA